MATLPASNFYGFDSADLATNLRALRLGSVENKACLVPVLAAADYVSDLWTLAIGGAMTSLSYTNSLGTVETITVASSTTAAGLLSALTDAVEADPTLRILQEYTLVATGSTSLTATAKSVGVMGTFSNTANGTWTHTTTGAAGSDLPLSRAVVKSSSYSGAGVDGVQAVDIPYGIGLQVITLTPVYAASSYYNIVMTLRNYLDGTDLPVSVGKVAASTNTATDCTAIAAAINAAMGTVEPAAGASFVADGSGGTTVTVTSEVPGLTATIQVTISGGAATCSVAYTTGSPGANGYDIDASFAGIVAFSSAIVDDTNGSPVIPARRMGAAIKRPGRVLVEVQSGDSPAEFGEVWVGTGSSNYGKLYAASAANRAPLSINTASWGPASGSYRWLNVNRAC